jgi:hypothetical protein
VQRSRALLHPTVVTMTDREYRRTVLSERAEAMLGRVIE